MKGGAAHKLALQELLRETRSARMADRLPEDRRARTGLLISIGMGDPGETAGEAAADEIEEEIDEETDY